MHPVEREPRIRVKHETFFKDTRWTCWSAGVTCWRARPVERVTGVHGRRPSITVAGGMRHGRLVKLPDRTGRARVRVDDPDTGRAPQISVDTTEWMEGDEGAGSSKPRPLSCWRMGGVPDVNLYREALVHFLGGAASVTNQSRSSAGRVVPVWHAAPQPGSTRKPRSRSRPFRECTRHEET